jgi:hypothetical protein
MSKLPSFGIDVSEVQYSMRRNSFIDEAALENGLVGTVQIKSSQSIVRD